MFFLESRADISEDQLLLVKQLLTDLNTANRKAFARASKLKTVPAEMDVAWAKTKEGVKQGKLRLSVCSMKNRLAQKLKTAEDRQHTHSASSR